MYEPPHNLERNKAVGNGQTETQDLDSHFLLCSLACKPSAALLTAKAGWAVGSLYTCCQMLLCLLTCSPLLSAERESTFPFIFLSAVPSTLPSGGLHCSPLQLGFISSYQVTWIPVWAPIGTVIEFRTRVWNTFRLKTFLVMFLSSATVMLQVFN